MSYIDDWTSIGGSQRDWLSQPCGNPRCDHARYMHGQVNRSRPKGGIFLNIDQGRCETCRCQDFMEYPPVSTDDVLAAHRLLKLEPIGLGDFGISPYMEEPPKEKTPEEPAE
jgi:hypothetical protein